MENYIDILQDSLLKKNKLLDELIRLSQKQEKLLLEEKMSLEQFDELVDQKDDSIQELIKLDTGFETLYNNVKEQLTANKNSYRSEIKAMQMIITEITEKSARIQTMEERNKAKLEQYFQKERMQLKSGRKTSRAAYDYYKMMNNSNIIPPQMMDQKK